MKNLLFKNPKPPKATWHVIYFWVTWNKAEQLYHNDMHIKTSLSGWKKEQTKHLLHSNNQPDMLL